MTQADAPRRLSIRQLIWLCLGVMSVVFVASVVFSAIGRVTVAHAVRELNGRLLPVQEKVAALNTAYVDQETGQRGFLLTADPVSLEPYSTGKAAADRLVADLRGDLIGDAPARQRLDSVVSAADAWTTQAAEPQIAARRSGSLPADQLKAMTLTGKRLFDQLRERLASLSARAGELIRHQLDRIHAAQRLADVAQVTTAGLLLAVVVGAVALFQRVLTRPVNRLVKDVREVAAGDYDHQITGAGPREVDVLADAVETMRGSLRTSTTRLLQAQRRDEQARMAANLHDRTIQRVFGLGLGLTAASARRSPNLGPFIAETDEIIRDLREVIFNLGQVASRPGPSVGLRSMVIDVVEGSIAALGFTPTLEFVGRVDECATDPALQDRVLKVLRESLRDVAHAKVTAVNVHVSAIDDELSLRIREPGGATIVQWSAPILPSTNLF